LLRQGGFTRALHRLERQCFRIIFHRP
jgi:hypothetical protein